MRDRGVRFELDFLRDYGDDALLEEIKRVAVNNACEALTAAEFERLSGRVSASTIRHRFGGWKNALALAGLEHLYSGPRVTEKAKGQHGKGMSNDKLAAEMCRIHALCGDEFLTKSVFDLHSPLSSETISRRFGGWRTALRFAGLAASPIMNKAWTREQCFVNIAVVWEHLGRRPHYDDMNREPSKINTRAYETRWGTWRRSLTEFVAWANDEEGQNPADSSQEASHPVPVNKRPGHPAASDSGARNVSLKVRFKVMRRDSFRCVACGQSPATHTNLSLHVDHIVPVALGGKSSEDNLQTLCEACNLGKGVSSTTLERE